MARLPRYIPPDALVEVTMRTLQGRMLLKPSAALNQIILDVLGRAQRRYEIPIHAAVFMSNHFHLLLSPPNAKRLSDFMCYINTNLSKRIGELYGWAGPMWQRRYDSIPVSEEEAAQVARLRYLLSHGCKENLVLRPRDWPGVHCVDAMLRGTPLKGSSGQQDGSEEVLELSPLPAWRHLSPQAYQQSVGALVEDIEHETEARHRHERTRPLGARKVTQGDPTELPTALSSGPKPRFHAATKKVREQLNQQFGDWLVDYRRASEAWRGGDLEVEFPPWSFPPPPPWVDGGRSRPG